MTTTAQILTALIEASIGQRDVADGIDPRKLDGRFQNGEWSFVVDWTARGGTVTCYHLPSNVTLRCRAGDLRQLGEFAARCVAPGEYEWPVPGQWPAPYEWSAAAGEFNIPWRDPVASAPRKREKNKSEWCQRHGIDYHGTCYLCETESP